MAKIANVALTNTFDTWRIRSNQSFNRLSQFTIDESKLYANTLTANVRFVSLGATKLGNANNDTTIVNGTLSANGRVIVNNNINITGNTTINRLILSGNTVTMSTAVLNIDTGLLFLQKNSNRVGVNTLRPNTAFHVNGVVLANSGYKYPDGALTTAPLYVYDSSGTQLYP
jgi:non-ribosomal peptide synthetase component F